MLPVFLVELLDIDPSEGMTNEELELVIRKQLEIVAPRWPDPSRLDDAVEAVT